MVAADVLRVALVGLKMTSQMFSKISRFLIVSS